MSEYIDLFSKMITSIELVNINSYANARQRTLDPTHCQTSKNIVNFDDTKLIDLCMILVNSIEDLNFLVSYP